MGKIYTFNNKIVTINNKWAEEYVEPVDPYNPPGGLPPNTVRVRTSDGKVPYKETYGATYETATLVAGTTDVYDVYKSGTSLNNLCRNSTNVTEILCANTTNITDMSYMFMYCTSLTNIPLFDTSSVTNMNFMFHSCNNVQSGALALYQQASTQTNTPTHRATFYNCGSNTQTGAAELAQIPSDWKQAY